MEGILATPSSPRQRPGPGVCELDAGTLPGPITDVAILPETEQDGKRVFAGVKETRLPPHAVSGKIVMPWNGISTSLGRASPTNTTCCRRSTYRLGFPNQEVAGAFSYHFSKSAAGPRGELMDGFQVRMIRALKAGDAKAMLEALRAFFATMPYDIALDAEKYYQSLVFCVFKMIGLDIQAEVRTNMGRIDAVARVPGFIYLFEFKIKGTSAAALEQIKEKRYYERYLGTGDKVILIGAGFSLKTRNITRPRIETV